MDGKKSWTYKSWYTEGQEEDINFDDGKNLIIAPQGRLRCFLKRITWQDAIWREVYCFCHGRKKNEKLEGTTKVVPSNFFILLSSIPKIIPVLFTNSL